MNGPKLNDMLRQKRRPYLRVDGIELSQHHSIDLVEATRWRVIRQGLPSGRPSKEKILVGRWTVSSHAFVVRASGIQPQGASNRNIVLYAVSILDKQTINSGQIVLPRLHDDVRGFTTQEEIRFSHVSEI